MTTKEEISRWFDQGVEQKSRFMIVMCDTFDHDDYPVFFNSALECSMRVKDPGAMQRPMEVYDLSKDKQHQLDQHRAWSLP